MSISEKLTKLNTDISNAYNSIETKGGTVPVNKNTENLASAIESIAGVAIYTVTFDSDGGTEVASQQIVSGYTAKEPETPTKADYFFDGWLLNGEFFNFETPITENITLVAKWHQQQVNYQMLYDYGNECADITGGWVEGYTEGSGTKTITKNQNNINMYTKGSYPTRITLYTENLIDFSEYVKVGARIDYEKGMYGSGYQRGMPRISLYDSPPTSNSYEKSTYGQWQDSDNSSSGSRTFSGVIRFNKNLTSPNNLNVILTSQSNGNNMICNLTIYSVYALKQDNWQELCTIAGLNSSDYTNEATLCSDSTSIATILNNEEAVKYMIYNCTGTFIAEFIASSTALTNLNDSTYKTLIHANEHWSKFLNMVA